MLTKKEKINYLKHELEILGEKLANLKENSKKLSKIIQTDVEILFVDFKKLKKRAHRAEMQI